MKTINSKTIKAMRPCTDRFENYLKFYGKKTFTIDQFCELENITTQDKFWVLLRMLDKFNVEVFAIDCALRAFKSADADAYAYAYAYADAYAYAVHVADAVHAAHAAHTESLSVLKNLIENGEIK